MTNIIVGNMVISIAVLILEGIFHALIRNGETLFVTEIIMAVIAAAVYYFIGKHSYRVKIWQVILIASICNAPVYAIYLSDSAAVRTLLSLPGILTMGPWLLYDSIAVKIEDPLFYKIAVIFGTWLPYILAYIGILAGRAKNREQYEVFCQIEKEQKARIKGYREERRKRRRGEL